MIQFGLGDITPTIENRMEKNGNRNGHLDCIGVYDRDLKRCQYYVELHYVPHTNIGYWESLTIISTLLKLLHCLAQSDSERGTLRQGYFAA